MANKKAKQRKKRMKKQMKKQLQNRIKETPIVGMTFREIEDMRVKEQTDLHKAKENERLERTAPYQEALNKKYGGTVTVNDKYINPRASLIHHCNECHKEWYARPMWLLTKENQKHVCGLDPVRMSEGTRKKNRTLTEMDKLKMYNMADKGISATKIATALDVSRTTVVKYLKKAEESRVLI